MKSFFFPDTFKKSISEALLAATQFEEPMKRLRGTIAKLGDGSLHVVHRQHDIVFRQYYEGKQTYLKKNSSTIYRLARKKYCQLLLLLLESRSANSKKASSDSSYGALLKDLFQFIDGCYDGGLDLARIVLTSQQYKWYVGKFRQKKPEGKWYNVVKIKPSNCPSLRSIFEGKITDYADKYSLPCHYEEQFTFSAYELVEALSKELQSNGQLKRNLCYIKGGTCYWNEPPEYNNMNLPGSIWRSYDPMTGLITIYPDFSIVLADGSLLLWEHEGLSSNFLYRYNASERVFVLLHTKAISRDQLVLSFQSDIVTPGALDKIIQEKILPRVWF